MQPLAQSFSSPVAVVSSVSRCPFSVSPKRLCTPSLQLKHYAERLPSLGKALEYTIANEPVGSRFGKLEGEEWIFLSSKDGDLKSVRTGSMYRFVTCTYSGVA